MSGQTDWRYLFKQYVKAVLSNEGVHFADDVDGLTDAQRAALAIAVAEAVAERPAWKPTD